MCRKPNDGVGPRTDYSEGIVAKGVMAKQLSKKPTAGQAPGPWLRVGLSPSRKGVPKQHSRCWISTDGAARIIPAAIHGRVAAEGLRRPQPKTETGYGSRTDPLRG
jgi:hypothetical protein